MRLQITFNVHLATVHARLHSAMTGHCVPHYHPTETATGAQCMVTTSYSHIRYLPGTSTSDLDSNCSTTSTYKQCPMCNNNATDGSQHVHPVSPTYMRQIAPTTCTQSAQPQSSPHTQVATECKPKPFASCIATLSSVKPHHHTQMRATHMHATHMCRVHCCC